MWPADGHGEIHAPDPKVRVHACTHRLVAAQAQWRRVLIPQHVDSTIGGHGQKGLVHIGGAGLR